MWYMAWAWKGHLHISICYQVLGKQKRICPKQDMKTTDPTEGGCKEGRWVGQRTGMGHRCVVTSVKRAVEFQFFHPKEEFGRWKARPGGTAHECTQHTYWSRIVGHTHKPPCGICHTKVCRYTCGHMRARTHMHIHIPPLPSPVETTGCDNELLKALQQILGSCDRTSSKLASQWAVPDQVPQLPNFTATKALQIVFQNSR